VCFTENRPYSVKKRPILCVHLRESTLFRQKEYDSLCASPRIDPIQTKRGRFFVCISENRPYSDKKRSILCAHPRESTLFSQKEVDSLCASLRIDPIQSKRGRFFVRFSENRPYSVKKRSILCVHLRESTLISQKEVDSLCASPRIDPNQSKRGRFFVRFSENRPYSVKISTIL